MTREEAIKKLVICGIDEACKTLDMLEALELIKFDKELTAFQVILRNLDFLEGKRFANRIYIDLKDNGFLKCP